MSETATDSGPVSATVVFARRVRPGREDEYLAWQAEINDACRTFPGCELSVGDSAAAPDAATRPGRDLRPGP